jgi:hypothetical protein
MRIAGLVQEITGFIFLSSFRSLLEIPRLSLLTCELMLTNCQTASTPKHVTSYTQHIITQHTTSYIHSHISPHIYFKSPHTGAHKVSPHTNRYNIHTHILTHIYLLPQTVISSISLTIQYHPYTYISPYYYISSTLLSNSNGLPVKKITTTNKQTNTK